jgi:hypothetical protein
MLKIAAGVTRILRTKLTVETTKREQQQEKVSSRRTETAETSSGRNE